MEYDDKIIIAILEELKKNVPVGIQYARDILPNQDEQEMHKYLIHMKDTWLVTYKDTGGSSGTPGAETGFFFLDIKITKKGEGYLKAFQAQI